MIFFQIYSLFFFILVSLSLILPSNLSHCNFYIDPMRGKYFGYNSKTIIEGRPKILGPLPTYNQLYPGLLDLKMLMSSKSLLFKI